jgi:hypothetical protein
MALHQRLPGVSLQPLRALLDDVAIVEHARFDHADPASGHCVDDAGRALLIACQLPTDPLAGELARLSIAFLEKMHLGNGRFSLRDTDRADAAVSDDGSARAIHGLGVAAGTAPWKSVRDRAMRALRDTFDFDSVHLRACAHATLGAVAIERDLPQGLDGLLDRMAARLAAPLRSAAWPWPEDRLTYGNAVVPHAILALAVRRRDRALGDRALRMLRWLLDLETASGHLSATPVGGWAPGEPRPGFDQQPIEAWTLADACRFALGATDDDAFGRGIEMAAAWFAGENDTGVLMWDPATGRSFDGLERHGVNRNQGAESALALIGTRLDLDWLERRAYRSKRATR